MNTQRKIDSASDSSSNEILLQPAAGAPYMEGPIGGQVALWQQQIDQHFGFRPPVDPVEQFVSGLSRLSGPTIFVAALGALVYWL